MTDASWDRSRCSVAGTLAVVGEKWSLLVLREAFLGVRRFADLQRVLGAPKAVLTDRLATLVEQGILRRVPYRAEGERQRHEYRLTEKGLDLYPTLVALMHWGDRWLAEEGDRPVELRHRDCGEPVRLALVCGAGHELSGAREVRPRIQPVAAGEPPSA
ncbi:helix-turn-helix transcriptional regulator [Geodermatophilus sp. YIM 151500]|uniref:winged helix-turn-helix transcriptional regulator n=1 Tax=Geodermatophilus sp. YIM 151500 TaxID=2984531 RepID=UPI0021E37FF9|nr:helix-turn-helix domain-containing protein [Geodermatophilus sp. YIM 151500]MCV2487803.1 helix-turn-helix transcriptional regulator [Geodermatophilus sp. YIM 151500]